MKTKEIVEVINKPELKDYNLHIDELYLQGHSHVLCEVDSIIIDDETKEIKMQCICKGDKND